MASATDTIASMPPNHNLNMTRDSQQPTGYHHCNVDEWNRFLTASPANPVDLNSDSTHTDTVSSSTITTPDEPNDLYSTMLENTEKGANELHDSEIQTSEGMFLAEDDDEGVEADVEEEGVEADVEEEDVEPHAKRQRIEGDDKPKYSVVSATADDDKPYKCEFDGCSKQYKRLNGLLYHHQTAHSVRGIAGDEKPFKCPNDGCHRAYKNSNGLAYHIEKNHSTAQLNDTPTVTNVVPSKRQKLERLAGEKPFVCPYPDCSKSFKNPNGLAYHLKHSKSGHDVRESDDLYKCPVSECTKAFRAASHGLALHLGKYHPELRGSPEVSIALRLDNELKQDE